MASDALNNGSIHVDDLKKLLLGLGIPGLTDKIAVEQVHTHTHTHTHTTHMHAVYAAFSYLCMRHEAFSYYTGGSRAGSRRQGVFETEGLHVGDGAAAAC